MINRRSITTVVLLVFLAFGTTAQKQRSPKPVKPIKRVDPVPIESKNDPTSDEKRVRDMVAFLGFVLNTLGNSSTSARDKDVLITESYSKIFRDAKVQVEDDLDEERGVITNKDVIAYLKDINFFFKEAKFEFTIEKIEQGTNADNHTFYKVTLHRNLNGTTIDGKVINNSTPRFIELNYNPKDQDLKIVSIYTNEFNEKDALRNWWKQLSFEWQTLFKEKINLKDSATLNDIKRVTSLEELDLGDNKYIQSFEPLSQLKNLKILNLSSSNINDLAPIRNLTDLVELNLSNAPIHDLTPLKYSGNLIKLKINNTEVSDIGIVVRMPKLQSLEASGITVSDFSPLASLSELRQLNLSITKISDLSPLESLNQLTELNISRTRVQDLFPLKGVKNLKTLVCDSTSIQNINALANLENLSVLQANHTLISDLQPLQKLKRLEKIYCDQTQIKKNVAEAFMATNPGTLVVFDSHDLKSWWDGLSPEWQNVISRAAKISPDPSKDELARVSNVDSINISGNVHINDLEPLRKFQRLRVIIANKTTIHDLSPLQELREIKHLDISESNVTAISAVSGFLRLKIMRADKCKIESIAPLQRTASLEKLFVDETGVNDINAQEFLQASPKCLLVYKTVHLTRWWKNLSENWKDVFMTQLRDTTRESLHKLVEQEALHFKDVPVSDLSGLSEFIRLRELHFSGTAIVDVAPVEVLKSLTSLHASNSPIQKIESLTQLTELEDLDISNTPLEDLTALWTLRKLKNLNCAGTQIKRLDALEKLEKLEYLDCSNTNVSKLNSLDYLHLKALKCYNTKVSNRVIENFKASHQECKIVYYR